ncbi:MAG: hypothetical protein U0X91_20715 [Spirosomataceae bacterium]
MKYKAELVKLETKISKAIDRDLKENGGAQVGALNAQLGIIRWAFNAKSIDFAIAICKQDIERIFRYTFEAEQKIEALESLLNKLVEIKTLTK